MNAVAIPAVETTPHRRTRVKRRVSHISFLTATCIVVANMIGTGVFTSLGFQIRDLHSPFIILLLWTIGGGVALCGALSYAELAAALPRSGGEYHFLSRIFHPAAGFLAGWTSTTVGFAAPIALAGMAFGTYAHGAWPRLPALALSLLVVWISAAVHFTGVRRGSIFQDAFTFLKIVLILLFVLAGWSVAGNGVTAFTPQRSDGSLIAGSAFMISLVYVMYAYSGWNASTYIVSEIKDPQRNVPRSLCVGTLIVLGLYVALNATFLRVAPPAELSGQLEVGLLAGRHLFGTVGGRVMAGLICLGLISSVSSMTWIGPRVAVAMGEDFRALRWLAVRTKSGIPRAALAFQTLIITGLLLTQKFEVVLIYIQLALILCSFLTVLGVFVLRRREPDLPRPYRTWGYPVTPLLFLIVSGMMMFYIVYDKPRESLAGLATQLTGLIVYFLSKKDRHRKTTA